jgi:hypothetical protein
LGTILMALIENTFFTSAYIITIEEIPFFLYFALQHNHWITQSPARELRGTIS